MKTVSKPKKPRRRREERKVGWELEYSGMIPRLNA